MREIVGNAAATHGTPPYFDPTCGAGDLLLAVSDSLGLDSSQSTTLAAWSENLFGADLEPSFAAVARHRLKLAALVRHDEGEEPLGASSASSGRTFGQVRAGDAIKRLKAVSPFDGTILLNPPFGTVPAPHNCRWGSGLVPRAALFVDAAVDAMAPGSTLVAILPDVLRSGARLERWRQALLTRLMITEARPLGQFDVHTDVDVFLLVGRRTATQFGDGETDATWPTTLANSVETVGSRFTVRTGAVVDNRDPQNGPWRSFATARSLPRRGHIDRIERKRRFLGAVVAPPFVLVRRTSRPSGDGLERATGVTVSGDGPIAVDNHLLVAIPRDGSLESCLELATVLEAPATTEWLDERIRCRHLTVGALSGIPWPLTVPDPPPSE